MERFFVCMVADVAFFCNYYGGNGFHGGREMAAVAGAGGVYRFKIGACRANSFCGKRVLLCATGLFVGG